MRGISADVGQTSAGPTASRWWNGGFHGERAVDPQVVADALRDDPDIRVVFGTHCETSTGVLHDVGSIGASVRERDALFVVDGISSVGAHPLPLEAWNVDLAVTASQKGLMLPPGMGFAAVGPRVWQARERCRQPKFYWDLQQYRTSLEEGRASPPRFRLRSLPVCRWRCRCFGRRASRGSGNAMPGTRGPCGGPRRRWDCHVSRGGLRTCSPAVVLPERVDGLALLECLRREFNVIVGGGLGEYRGRMVRVVQPGARGRCRYTGGRCGARIRAPEGRMGF